MGVASLVGSLLLLQGILLTPKDTPPTINANVYALATKHNHKYNMNILTYATPVGIRPHRMWAISLYKKTQTFTAFTRTKTAILQLLAEEHASLTFALGGTSAADVPDNWKRDRCREAGFEWVHAEQLHGDEMVLPGCVAYYRLKQHGPLIDAGDHQVAICHVESVWTLSGDVPYALTTQALRAAGLVSDAGRAIDPQLNIA